MRARILAVATAALASGGCLGIYGEISDLEDQTVVNESSRPDDVGSDDYAIQTVFGGSGADGLKVTVLGSGPAGIVNLRFDRAGELDSSGVQLGTDFNDIDADVAVSSFPARFDQNDSVAIGLPIANGGGRVALFSNSASQIDTKQYRTDYVADGVALGATNAAAGTDPAEPDMVIAGGGELRLFASYPEVESATNAPPAANTFFCAVAGETVLNVVAGDVLGADGIDEVVVSTGATVRVIDASTIEAQATAAEDCFAPTPRLEIAAPGGETDFGKRMLVADLDGNSVPDLILAAPGSNAVYVFVNPVDGDAGTPVMITGEGGFGAAIAAGDLDADGTAELAVGAPGASPDGVSGAGQVQVFDVDATAATALTPLLFVAGAETNGAFGRALTVGAFDDADDLLVVGAHNKVFVYFQHPFGSDTDARMR